MQNIILHQTVISVLQFSLYYQVVVVVVVVVVYLLVMGLCFCAVCITCSHSE
jgi:hypothetical protein